MAANTAPTEVPKRPQHRRNASSKSNIFRALVSSNTRTNEKDTTGPVLIRNEWTQTVPLLPPDHPHAGKTRVLGERHENSAASPRKSRSKQTTTSISSNALVSSQATPTFSKDPSASPKKTKSSTNLAGMLGKVNRTSKDTNASAPRDKENTTPPSSSDGPRETPIWAQFATTAKLESDANTKSSKSSYDINDEIARYTPQQYSPSKQRNFDGTFERPQLRPTLANRPQSMYVMGADLVGAIGRRVSGDKTDFTGRKSEDLGRRWSKEWNRRDSGEKGPDRGRDTTARKTSGSSAEQALGKEKLDIAKRGGRVMAAVAAWQGKTKDVTVKAKEEPPMDPQAVEEAFESVLDSRNIPEPMRQKMRSLTVQVKVDFIKQHQGASATGSSRADIMSSVSSHSTASTQAQDSAPVDSKEDEDDSKSTKRSRARSRTFTFSKGDKRGDGSPSKKQRSSSKVRSASTRETINTSPTTPTTPRSSMDKRRSAGPAAPSDFISYLRNNQDPVNVEVGRLHKLRILLRNETVAWVDSFVSLGGMTEVVGLLHRIMAIEWREEHEDQLLHETLLCLKGMCTTERALGELEKVADALFPALIGMLFDNEKKGPAEYTTRTIIITVLFNFLAAETSSTTEALEARARRILAYFSDPTKPEEARPVHFVLDMRSPRPYKVWCRELTHVTKEVFWIFLHHLNIVPRPKSRDELFPTDSDLDDSNIEEREKALTATYTRRHFPGTRPPVPAAPYIGGVEWDATTYLTAHLDLLNGLLASLPSTSARNTLRAELQASGFEKVLGATLRTCKEKFYAGVHDGLRAWVAAAAEDGWDTRYVREGPPQEEQAASCGSPRKSPKKKEAAAAAPKIAIPRIEASGLDLGGLGGGENGGKDDFDDGWLG